MPTAASQRHRRSFTLQFNHDGQIALFGNELHRDRVDTVPRVLGRESFTEKHMSQMATAIMTNDLGAASIGVDMSIDRIRNLIVKAGPSTLTVELIRGTIERGIAATTNIPC